MPAFIQEKDFADGVDKPLTLGGAISMNILLKLTGSIACYKACHVISRLVQKGHRVQVVASSSALRFVGETTLEGLTGQPVFTEVFARTHMMDHIHLNRSNDMVLVCPATAHFINKASKGLGDDLLTTLFLSHDFHKPYVVVPAMNSFMYRHPVTQDSLKALAKMNVDVLPTDRGTLACGEVGEGKLLDPEKILHHLEKYISPTSDAEQPAGWDDLRNGLRKPAGGRPAERPAGGRYAERLAAERFAERPADDLRDGLRNDLLICGKTTPGKTKF